MTKSITKQIKTRQEIRIFQNNGPDITIPEGSIGTVLKENQFPLSVPLPCVLVEFPNYTTYLRERQMERL